MLFFKGLATIGEDDSKSEEENILIKLPGPTFFLDVRSDENLQASIIDIWKQSLQ